MRIATIKFRNAGKRYDFNAQQLELKPGDQVVVETDRGRALGIVITAAEEREQSDRSKELRNILRHANDEDRKLAEVNAKREREAILFCQQRIAQRGMDMKLVRAEYLFDGSKIIFFFTADGRVDFRELVKDLAHYFHTRIEMRQIGVRDEAKLVGGLGVCGRELCCCTFLTEFAPVSVKMAKEQGLALNPNKISGQCGRLLCCLGYEFETYCEHRKGLPKCGKKIDVCGQKAQVLDVNVLGREVTLGMEDGQKITVTGEQLATGDIEALQPGQQQKPGTEADRSEGRPVRRNRPTRGPGNDRRSGETKKEDTPQKPQRPQPSAKPPRPEPVGEQPPEQPPGDGQPKRRRRRRRRKPKASE